jgi:hypothetical protein
MLIPWRPPKREIRCGTCHALNRVPAYSVRRIPHCGKCHANLPETGAVKIVRVLQTSPVNTWIVAPAFALCFFLIGSTIYLMNTAPAASCASIDPVPINGIYRMYDILDRSQLTQWTINAGYGTDYFVKLTDAATEQPKISYFVHGGSVLTIDAPLGLFTVKHASGHRWCDEATLFGSDTSLQKGTHQTRFDEDHTYTLYLTPRPNGNFPTVTIQRNEF